MITFDKILNGFSQLNLSQDISNRGTGTKLIVVIGMILALALAVTGTIHLANSK